MDDAAVQLDGRLRESAWRVAPVATGFTQRQPADGIPASERTEVRVLYSRRAIYVGVRAFDAEADAIRSQLVRRDAGVQSDLITVYLDSYHDRRTCFEFAVTPGGAIRDVYHSDDSPWGDDSWDPVWEVHTSIDSAGWTAEFRIPFSQLRYDRQGTSWGLQVSRRIERNAEEVWWAPFSKASSGFTSLFGVLEGLEDLPVSRRLELRPYSVASGRWRPEGTGSVYAPGRRGAFDTGVDVKFGLTSDFTLDLSVNPDFGQVEADPAVVNLTAFETYFPERRPFFIEGAGLFNRYAPAGELFYSRRVGRRPQGSASPSDGGTVETPEASTILSALKVTGKSARGLGLGIMSAVTTSENATLRDSTGAPVGDAPVQPWVHHFVGRVERDFRRGSHTIGAMLTALNRQGGDDFDFLSSAAYVATTDGRHRWRRNTYGIEWRLAVSRVQGSERAIRSLQRSPFRYYQRPDATHVTLDTTRTSLDGYAMSVEGGKQAGTWQYYGYYARVSPGFDLNDLGFQWSADYQEASFGARYRRTDAWWIFRDFTLGPNVSQNWTTGGEATGLWFRPVYLGGSFRNNWSISFNPLAVIWNRFSPGALRGGPGLRQNDWRNSFLFVGTDSRHPVSGGLWASAGGEFATPARWASLEPSVEVRPSGSVTASLGIVYAWERDPTQWIGRWTVQDSTRYLLATIERQTLNLSLRLDWALSPVLSVQLYAQPYVTAGRYRQFKEVRAPLASRFADRFRPLADEITCGSTSCAVDLDADGTSDITFDQPDFNFHSLRSTAVLRWEYRPGSVLYVAWQHGRSDYRANAAFRPTDDLRDLFALEADNTLLVKVNYWLAF